MRATSSLLLFGFALIAIGILTVMIGSLGSASSSNTSTGIVIFIGPIPIVFGSGSNGGILVLIGLVAAIGMILLFYLPFLVRRRRLDEEEERG
jgi:uncharacterized membrane protein